jgi:hypothetical protein
MRRLLATLLLMIVPFQFAWSAVQGVHVHPGDDAPVAEFHAHHDADHAHADAAPAASGAGDCSHNADGHHDGHCHLAFSMILSGPAPALAATPRGGAPAAPPLAFTSHIPPLFDWPPSARR